MQKNLPSYSDADPNVKQQMPGDFPTVLDKLVGKERQ
jgi:hypothetical protein